MAAVETRAVQIKDVFKSDLFIAGSGALILFAVLLLSLAPIIYVADSALLTTSSYYLSTAFPPGYPVFVTLGKFFTFLPAGSIAYRTNLTDAVPACAAFLLVFGLIRRLTGNKVLALSAAFLSALLPLVFSESLMAEVFTLNSVFCLLVLYLGLRALEDEDARFIYAASFLFGLGTGHHHTLALLLAPVAYPACKLALKRPALLLYCLIFLTAGLFINLHIVLRSFALKDSGFLFSTARDLHDFLFVFFRKAYPASTFQALQSIGGGGKTGLAVWGQGFLNLVKYVIFANFGPVTAVIVLAAAALLPFTKDKRDRYLFLALVPWLFLLPRMTLTGVIQAEHNIDEVRRYFVPLLYILCVILALQANRIYFLLKSTGLRTVKIASVLLIAPFFYAPSVVGSSASGNYLAYDRARDALSVMPPESTFILFGDNPSFGTYYIQWIERYRDDILTFSKDPYKDAYTVAGRSSLIFDNNNIHNLFKPTEKDDFSMNTAVLDATAAEGKLFVSYPLAMLKKFNGRYVLPAYGPLTFMASFEGRPSTSGINAFLVNNFQKLNFERNVNISGETFFADEIKNLYGSALLTALSLKKPEPGDQIYMNAGLRLVNPENFLPYFVNLLARKRTQDPLLFLRWAEQKLPGSKMADMAHVLEYVILSEVGSNAAAAKYDYLAKNGLLIYVANVKTLYDKTMKDAGISMRLSSSSGK